MQVGLLWAGRLLGITGVALTAVAVATRLGGSYYVGGFEAVTILKRLGLSLSSDNTWYVPPFRADLQRHIDLVEEIVRVKGLDAVPSRLRGTFVPTSAVDLAYDADMRLRERLAPGGARAAVAVAAGGRFAHAHGGTRARSLRLPGRGGRRVRPAER